MGARRDRDRNGSDGAGAASPTERLAWFKIYPGDMLSETRGWPLVARGAYWELLAAQWDVGLLPRDPRRLRTLASATAAEWRVAWPRVESKFPITNGGRQNPTLEVRRREAHELRERRRAGAQQTNAARWSDRSATRSPIAQRVAERVASQDQRHGRISTEEDGTQGRTTVVDPGPRGAGR